MANTSNYNPKQLELVPPYEAHTAAHMITRAIESEPDGEDIEIFLELTFTAIERAGLRREDFAALHVVGLGTPLMDASVVWFPDGSILVVGWETDEDLQIGVLPPDTTFTPVPFDTDTNTFPTLH